MENKDSTVKMDPTEDPEVVSVEPEHEEGVAGGEIQQPTTSKNADEKCVGEGEGGDAQPPPAIPIECPLSLNDFKAQNLHDGDEDTDAGWQTADDESDDEVTPPQQEKIPKDEPNEVMEAIKALQLQLQNKPDENVKIQGPPQLQVSLYDHQEHALAWMLWRESCTPSGGILADDMGLGKTITTIALILKSLENESLQKTQDSSKNTGGTLIVCPANLMSQWRHEIETQGNIANVIVHLKENETSESILTESQVVITSYQALSQNYKTNDKILFKINWKRVVLDEAHVIRLSDAHKTNCVSELIAEKRWVLTAAPIHKEVNNIFPILRFLKLKSFDDSSLFNKWIATDGASGRLQRVLECLMLRRTRESLMNAAFLRELPAKNVHLIDVVMAPEEKSVYELVMTYSRMLFIKFVRQMEERERQMAFGDDYKNNDVCSVQLRPVMEEFLEHRGVVSLHHIVALITRLRQFCCHPELTRDFLEREDFEGTGVDFPDAGVLMETDRKMLQGLEELDMYIDNGAEEMVFDSRVFDEDFISSKITGILVKVQEIMEKGEKVVVVSDWVNLLSLIGQRLGKIPGAHYQFYIGTMSFEEKARVVDEFNNSEGTKILLGSMKAGVQRLNLKAANHVIIADVHWNPMKELQAHNIVHRVGQMKQVVIHKFVCRDTIEEGIVEILEKKGRIAEAVRDRAEREFGKLEIADISSLFKM